MFHVKRALAVLLWLAIATASQAQERVQVPANGLALTGLVYRPAGAGPFPGAVILHGCSGMWTRSGEPTASYRFWAEHLRREGFVALLLDSFGPRGEKEICTQQNRRVRPDRERKADAMAALRWLAGQPGVDGDRIVLLGFSNGAATVLHTALEPPADGTLHFRAAVAFYPGCGALARAGAYRPRVPVLIQAGGADDWTPAKDCEALATSASPPDRVEIDVYPGAHHAFDRVDGRVRFRPEVRNLNSPQGKGATVGPHPEARERAVKRTTIYLETATNLVPRGTRRAVEDALP